MSPPDRDLRAAAGDFVAGDLDRQESDAFRALLADDETLRAEVDFWHRIRPAMRASDAGEGLGPGFAQCLSVRLQRERDARPRIIRMPVLGPVVALLAAGLIVAAILRSPLPEGTGHMYAEDGAALATTGPTGGWDDYLPMALVSNVHIPDAGLTGSNRVRPWIGLWTRPVQVDHDGHHGGGHLVLRIAGGSPADRIGLRPGDVIRSLDDCPVFTSACIAHHLETVRPGATIVVDYWRPSTGEHVRASLVTERLYE